MAGKDKQRADPALPTRAMLREQAEARLRKQVALTPKTQKAMSPAATDELLHELRVHQIELEMQNDELRFAQVELDASRARYFDLYDLAPIAYCTVSDAGLIVQANLSAAALLGVERGALIRQPLSRFIVKEDQDSYYLLRKRNLIKGEAHSGELRMARCGGGSFWAQLTINSTQVSGAAATLRIVLSDVSERKQAEAVLLRGEAFGLAILDALSAQIAVLDRDGGIVAVNQSWQRFASANGSASCWPIPSASGGSNYLAVCQSTPAPASASALQACDGIKAVLNGRRPGFNLEYTCAAGEQQRWFSMSVTPLEGGVVVAHTDFTELKQAEEAVRKQKEFFHLIAENIGDFIAVLDLDGRRLYNSPSYAQFFGPERDLRGSDSFAEIHPEDKKRVKQVFSETVRTGIGRQIDYRLRMADGTIREMESRGNVIRDSDGRIAQVVVVSHDITERHRLEVQMQQLAFQDALTQLPNRRLLVDRLSQAMAASARSASYAALMFLDLDHFKRLNDTHGHAIGDLLLIQAADRLKRCVRETDTVARFGGDEYVVVIGELDAAYSESRSLAEAVAEKIRGALVQPFLLEIEQQGAAPIAIEHRCTASIGIVLFIDHQASPDDILKRADAAMYEAKAAGRNMIRFYEAPD